MEYGRWEVGLVEMSYPKGHKKRMVYYLRLVSMEIKFPVKQYESLYDLNPNLTRNFKLSKRKEQFITTFNEQL